MDLEQYSLEEAIPGISSTATSEQDLIDLSPYGNNAGCSKYSFQNDESSDYFDISSSSLIKSPLITELLLSHGLLKNGHIEDIPLDLPDTQFKLSQLGSIDDNYGPPSFLRVYSLQPQSNSYEFEEEEEEMGDYRCGWESCDMFFSCRKDLAQHVNSSHIYQDKNSLYRCQWSGCVRQGKAINARYRMLIHVRTHTHEKPHICDLCGKRFSRLENLRIHIRSHTGEKPFVCPVVGCNKAYSNSSDRFKHSKTHQEDKPYVCRVEGCDKRYTDPSSLRKHMKSTAHIKDNGLKPTVNHCMSSNIQSSSLKERQPLALTDTQAKQNHIENFILSRPYACRVEGCGKRYTDPSSLRKHQRSTSHGRDGTAAKMKMAKTKAMKDLAMSAIKEEEASKNDENSSSLTVTENHNMLISPPVVKLTKDHTHRQVERISDNIVKKERVNEGNDDLIPLDLSTTCSAPNSSMDCLQTLPKTALKS